MWCTVGTRPNRAPSRTGIRLRNEGAPHRWGSSYLVGVADARNSLGTSPSCGLGVVPESDERAQTWLRTERRCPARNRIIAGLARACPRGVTGRGYPPPRGGHDEGAWSRTAPAVNAYLFLSRARARTREGSPCLPERLAGFRDREAKLRARESRTRLVPSTRAAPRPTPRLPPCQCPNALLARTREAHAGVSNAYHFLSRARGSAWLSGCSSPERNGSKRPVGPAPSRPAHSARER